MENQEKILLLVTGLLVVAAIYFLFVGAQSKPPITSNQSTGVDVTAARALAMKGLEFGLHQQTYEYSFTELSDGYRTAYQITGGGNESLIELQNPLSDKRIFFLQNDTILCIKYLQDEKCTSVQGNPDLNNYLASLRVRLFNDTIIDGNKNGLAYLIDNKYVAFTAIADKSVNGKSCKEVRYRIDYSNMSVNEAAIYGIGANSPKVFDFTMCVDEATGALREKSFNYSVGNATHKYTFTLVTYKPGSAGTISPPENLSYGAVDILINEKQAQITMANCYAYKQGEELDKCIANVALNIHKKDLCDFSGSWKDRCLVALVPVTKDTTICPTVASPSFKDDCYIELAGAYKNSSYCSNLLNASKLDFCQSVSVPQNQTNSTFDVKGLMDSVDKDNSTGTNGTG